MRKIFITGILISLVAFTGCYYYGPCINGIGPSIFEVREITDFTEVKNEGSFDVRITEADEFFVEIEAQENLLPIIETFVSGSTLVIQKQFGTCFRSNSPIIVYVSLPRLEAVKLTGSGKVSADVGDSQFFDCINSGSGKISVDTVFSGTFGIKNSGSGTVEVLESYADEISLVLTGSGTVDAGTVYNTTEVNIRHSASGRIFCSIIDGVRVEASLSGSGRIILDGDAVVADYSLSSSGKVDALDLIVTDAEATITGSGNIYVYATDHLDATITGSGYVRYRGNPVITSHITGSGSVRAY